MSVVSATRVAMVSPPRAVVVRGIAPMRANPDDATELVDEAQYGELVTCLGARGDWTYVQGPDLYFGWVRTAHLAGSPTPQAIVVAVPLAQVRAAPSVDAEIVDELPAGAPIARVEEGRDWWQLGADRFIRADETVSVDALPHRYPTPDDLLATAQAYLGVPYVWGGTSALGIDCSGLTQQVYRLNGVGLDRDADQQALGGRPVEVARPGDLFFFGADRVTHTAIATGETTFLHAPESGKTVQLGAHPSNLRAIRRYLP